MKLKYNFSIQKVLDFWAAVPVGNDAKLCACVISLNETGQSIMQLLRNDMTEEELVDRLKQEYDVLEEQLRTDVHTFVQKLRDDDVLTD